MNVRFTSAVTITYVHQIKTDQVQIDLINQSFKSSNFVVGTIRTFISHSLAQIEFHSLIVLY